MLIKDAGDKYDSYLADRNIYTNFDLADKEIEFTLATYIFGNVSLLTGVAAGRKQFTVR